MFRPITILYLIFQLSYIALAGQEKIYNYRHYTTKDNLPSDIVNSLKIDSYGYLWVATSEGLSRFDGTRFNNFREHFSMLLNPSFFDIEQLGDSAMLFASGSGIFYFNFSENRFEDRFADIPMLRPGNGQVWHSIVLLPENRILLSSYEQLMVLDSSLRMVARKTRPANSGKYMKIPDPVVFPLDGNQDYIMYNPDSVLMLNIRTLEEKPLPEKLREAFGDRDLFTVVRLKDGGLFYSGWGTGGNFYYGTREKYPLYQDAGSNTGFSHTLDPDLRDVIWMGMGKSLVRVDCANRQFTSYEIMPEPARHSYINYIHGLAFDSHGNLWIGTHEGVVKLNRDFRAFIMEKHYENNIVHYDFIGAVVDSKDRLWIGSWGRNLRMIDRKKRAVMNFEGAELPDGLNVKLLKIRDTIYVASYKGFHYYDERTAGFKSPYFIPDSLRLASCFSAILLDSHGILWINFSSHGMFTYDAGSGEGRMYRRFGTPADGGFPMRAATAIAEDRDGNIWFGLSWATGKLVKWERTSGKFSIVEISFRGKRPEHLFIQKLMVDGKNRLWGSLQSMGIFCLDPVSGETRFYNRNDGLPSYYIHNFAADKNGRIWIATSNGIGILNPDNDIITVLNTGNGLPFNDVKFLGFPDEKHPELMLFGNNYRLAWCETTKLTGDIPLPRVYIENVWVQRKAASLIPGGSYSHSRNDFTFGFTAVNLVNGEANRYAYQLQGVDNDWVYAGREQMVSFGNLSPGSYNFRVKAFNGYEWTEPVEYTFTILPPFWQTWWFYTLATLFLILAAYGIYRYQLSKAIALYRLRNKISSDLHDEVGSTLSAVTIMNEMAGKETQENGLRVRISEQLMQAQNSMSEIVWMINPKNDALDNFILRLGEVASNLLEPKNIAYRIITGEGMESVSISMEKRREVFLIFKECLNNIIKYSACTEVVIEFNMIRNRIMLIISDNGRGFDTGRKTSGNGIQNMKGRAIQIKGRIVLESVPGNGTRVMLAFPAG